MQALKDHLDGQGWRALVITVPDMAPLPYVLLSPMVSRDFDPNVARVSGDVVFDFQTTIAADSVTAALGLSDAVRAFLSPEKRPTRIPLVGRVVEVRHERFQLADVDRDVTAVATNNRRAFAKDVYRLISRETKEA